MNVIQLFMQMMNSQNPSAFLQQLAASNPAAARALEMSKGKGDDEIRQICENLCRQRGLNFSEVLSNFRNMTGRN